MRTFLSLIAIIALTLLIYLAYANWNIQSDFTVPILGFSERLTVGFSIAVAGGLGFLFGLCQTFGLYRSQKQKAEMYYRELEKVSVSNIQGDDKVKVLENKIQVLEKALEDALKK